MNKDHGWRDDSTAGDTYATLKNRIVHLQYRPGEVLMVQRLAAELGVSRTPVREALVRLTEEGLVGPTDGRKFQVSMISMQTIDELYELRESLESVAAQGAAERRTDEDLAILRGILDEMVAALERRDLDTFFESDWRFHDTIGRIHGNRTMMELLHRLRGRIQRIRFLTRHVDRRVERTVGEHEAVLEAIASGDPPTARAALLEHLTNTHNQIREYLRSQSASALPVTDEKAPARETG